MSAAHAFLRPAMKRANLRVETHAHVTRIVFEGARATGVEYVKGGITHTAPAGRDIVKDGVIGYTPRGTMKVPTGPGLGVEIDPEKFALAVDAHKRQGDISIYAADHASHGRSPVKSQW
jgi:L-alanine-DL-glutamate epimerase-like enolase superfamily enzyme